MNSHGQHICDGITFQSSIYHGFPLKLGCIKIPNPLPNDISIPSNCHMPRSPSPPLNIPETSYTPPNDPEPDPESDPEPDPEPDTPPEDPEPDSEPDPDLTDSCFDFVVRGASDPDVIISDDEFEDVFNEKYQYLLLNSWPPFLKC